MFAFSTQSLAVGAITDEKALSESFTLSDCDIIELRLDALGSGPAVIEFMKRHQHRVPLLITARDPSEGGKNELGIESRKALFNDTLPFASLIDIELANL